MWRDPGYLKRGNDTQRRAFQTLVSLRVFERLAAYDPVLVGTIPIDVDIKTSDLDVICDARNLDAFERDVREHFGAKRAFAIKRNVHHGVPAVIARFETDAFPIEIFGQPLRVAEQAAYRHMVVEARLLQLGGQGARDAIRELKRAGVKTEPAFAQHFNIAGDPYAALLDLFDKSDNELRAMIGASK